MPGTRGRKAGGKNRHGIRTRINYRCAYCEEPGAVAVRPLLVACADAAACSDRMQAQGLGRRDWHTEDQAGMRDSLRSLLLASANYREGE